MGSAYADVHNTTSTLGLGDNTLHIDRQVYQGSLISVLHNRDRRPLCRNHHACLVYKAPLHSFARIRFPRLDEVSSVGNISFPIVYKIYT